VFPDGTIHTVERSGVRTVEHPNGEKEIIYPDGMVEKIVDGKVQKYYE